MDVGKPRRRVTVEPVQDPVPAKRPETEPAERPQEQPAEPAKQAR
jgi:hypothetical protein